MGDIIKCAIAILFVLLILIIFQTPIMNLKNQATAYFSGTSSFTTKMEIKDDDDFREHMNDPKNGVGQSADTVNATLDALGYTADAPWDQVLQATELDPSTFANHMDFVKDVRRFSSGANFTSVTDDNTNQAFTNFTGLRRPEHVPIGTDARQQPDIDQSVLQRNRPLRW